MRKVVILTSDSLRHKYFIKKISEYFDVIDIFSQKKKNYYTKRTPFIQEHFDKLSKTEKIFFEDDYDNFSIKKVENINDMDLVKEVINKKPDFIALFGTSILKDIWLDNFENKIINLHLGLSPFYRGSGTLFWPFYYDEIECIGATIHLARKKVDSGEILARIKSDIEENDNYYTLNYKTIKKAINVYPKVVNDYLDEKIIPLKQNINNSKVFKKKDFNEEALKKVLEKYGTKIKYRKEGKCNC
jgi:folate-dependent phosphoribosylglycinamide formyltransferase PurN